MGGVPSRGIALLNPELNPTAIPEEPANSRLQASPNPFERSLAIAFTLEKQMQVEVIVIDLQGRRVATLLDQMLPSGPQQTSWDARDSQGRRVSPGVYFVRVRQGERTESRQIVLLE